MTPSEHEARPTGIPDPPGRDPGDRSRDPDPHHALNTPIGEPDPTEWPDPYERRPDPRGGDEGDPEAHTASGATSTSAPHPRQDPQAVDWEAPDRDRADR